MNRVHVATSSTSEVRQAHSRLATPSLSFYRRHRCRGIETQQTSTPEPTTSRDSQTRQSIQPVPATHAVKVLATCAQVNAPSAAITMGGMHHCDICDRPPVSRCYKKKHLHYCAVHDLHYSIYAFCRGCENKRGAELRKEKAEKRDKAAAPRKEGMDSEEPKKRSPNAGRSLQTSDTERKEIGRRESDEVNED
jgi:hypothetical protein